MANAAVARDVFEPRDIRTDLALQLALDHVILFEFTGDPRDLILGEFVRSLVRVEIARLDDLGRLMAADPVDVGATAYAGWLASPARTSSGVASPWHRGRSSRGARIR